MSPQLIEACSDYLRSYVQPKFRSRVSKALTWTTPEPFRYDDGSSDMASQMTRPEREPAFSGTCAATGKLRYRDPNAAAAAGRATLRRSGRQLSLASSFRCRSCGDFHWGKLRSDRR